ncbi:MAG: response regulator transcription factor [Acetobacterales bacterium]
MAKFHSLLVVAEAAAERTELQEYFRKEGFQVAPAASPELARRIAMDSHVDLILMRVPSPDAESLKQMAEFCHRTETPLVITAARATAIDRIVALEMGADEYVTEPFERRELLARMRSVLRRYGRSAANGQNRVGVLRFAGWTMDLRRRVLSGPSGRSVELTPVEFDLLATFAATPHRVVSRDTLMRRVRDREWSPLSRTIDVHVGHLRRKIEPNAKQPQFIKTVHGVGYLFTPTVHEAHDDGAAIPTAA